MRVLLVEDDRVIAEQVAEALRGVGYTVDAVGDGESALVEAAIHDYGLILLDVMLPGRDGWQVCAALRRRKSTVPVLMLTARDAIEDRVRGLDEGADDYLTKPFDVRELLARVGALLRRDKLHRTGIIRVADLEVDTRAHAATRGGEPLNLTPREFSLLEALARNEGRVLTRQVILESVWDNEEALENTVNFHITSLRKKVDQGHEHKLIQTVYGIGYSLRAP